MRAPSGVPPRIRTDSSNRFAHDTLAVRVPAIVDAVLERNPDYAPRVRERIAALAAGLRSDARLPAIDEAALHADEWLDYLSARSQESWLSSDWFTAENYAYRCLADASDFWRTGRDPFRPIKLDDYRSLEHRDVLEAAVAIGGQRAEQLERLLLAAVFGNRMDLSFAAARERGVQAEHADLLIDDRRAAREALEHDGGPVHLVLDNAGTELSVDLVLACRILELTDAPVVLHVKVHPCFVSDTIARDLDWFLEAREPDSAALWNASTAQARSCREQLEKARLDGRLRIAPHAFWSGPRSLWECPAELEHQFSQARLVIVKGDAHYRRVVGDAIWPADTSFRTVTSYFPAPLLALRTLKSDPIVGLRPGQAAELDAQDPRWRVNAKRAVACLGGNAAAASAGSARS
jgi:uncharacterized protein with ATP-grasp and redox domains